MEHAQAESIRVLVSELLEKMSVPGKVSIQVPFLPVQGEFVCLIQVEDGSNLLIGQHGANLEALQVLVRNLSRRRFDGWSNFSIDINEYFYKKAQAIFEETEKAKDRVIHEGIAVTLRPMTAFERKCVHTAVVDSQQVETESIGEGNSRRVVIKPKTSENNQETKTESF